MRASSTILLALILVVIAGPALAATTSNPYDVSWSALSPGNDWAAGVLRSVFPIPGDPNPDGSPTVQETTVIQMIVGQFTGFVGAIACAFLVYTTIMHIHRAAESSRILGQGQSWMFVARLGFAGVMMFPIGGGFSAGQALVMQGAMTGIGMADAVYKNAIQAVGPDAVVIATPAIPSTNKIVAGLIDNELCMDLVNLASNTAITNNPLVPIPQGGTISSISLGVGGQIEFAYGLSTDNQTGNPVCGSVTIQEPASNQAKIAGVSIDMSAVQQSVLNDVLNGAIRMQVAAIAQDLWSNKSAGSLAGLNSIYTSAVSSYTNELTKAASSVGISLNAALKAQATQERNGASDLLAGEVQQSTLGWAGAGAYYLEIAKLNATTLSLMNATPVLTPPTYAGLSTSLETDLAPLVTAEKQYMQTLDYMVQTQDGSAAATGTPYTLTDAKEDAAGHGVLTWLFGRLNLSSSVLQTIDGFLLPNSQVWTDPFGGLMNMGQTLINTALGAMTAAALLSSTTVTVGTAFMAAVTGNEAGAAAAIAGHAFMGFFATPIFVGLLALLIPGLTIAYVLPMVPYAIWMAGVAGWLILVCEAMIAVPLWMLAHMTVGGDGLHGRGTEGWGLLFNVVFRPTLMVIGLFLGYFIFDCMSWLIRETFGVAAGFALNNGWIVTNFLGLGVLLTIFASMQIAAAMLSFRMVTLLPHHLPRLIGFSSANRVDMDQFQQTAVTGAGERAAGGTSQALQAGSGQFRKGMQTLSKSRAAAISAQSGASGGSGGMDSTLAAISGPSSTAGEREEASEEEEDNEL